jgi:hypothetical protein
MRKFAFLLLLCTYPLPELFAQTLPGRLSSIEGVSILVPSTVASTSLGVSAGQLEEVARVAASTSGWRIEESSDLVIAVSVDSVGMHAERVTLRIGVRGGISSGGLTGEQNGMGNFYASRTIDATRADSSRILSVATQLVQNVSQKLHREYLRLAYPQPPPKIDNSMEILN